MISVRECASFAGLTPGEICLGVSPSAKHRVLQSRYLLGLWQGARTVRNLIVADIRHWLRIGDPDRAADAFIVLRQFLADFPQAQLAPVSVRSLSLRGRPRGEGRRHRSRNLSCRRVGIGPALPNISPGTISPDDMETRETAIRQPPAWRSLELRRARRAWEKGHEAACRGVNRVADPGCPASGGLAVCILDGLKERGGLWFGWNGDVVTSKSEIGVSCRRDGRVTFVTMPFSERDYKEHYLGFCNAALWPVLHYRLDLARFTPESCDAYRRVNRRFAEALAPQLHPDDLVWVHDYHLIPVAAELRARGVGNRIGFFLHIPFPPPEMLVAVPEHEWLMRAMLAYDVVGFQTSTDQANFCRFLCEVMGGEMVTSHVIRVGGRSVTASVFPAGVCVNSLSTMARRAEAERRIQWLHRRGEPRINIISVDRLDFTKACRTDSDPSAVAGAASGKSQGRHLDADRAADARGGEGLRRHSPRARGALG